jgi:hypothetical protein
MKHTSPKSLVIAKHIKKPDHNGDRWIFFAITAFVSTTFFILWITKMMMLANGV